MPGTISGLGDRAMQKADKVPVLMSLHSGGGDRQNDFDECYGESENA